MKNDTILSADKKTVDNNNDNNNESNEICTEKKSFTTSRDTAYWRRRYRAYARDRKRERERGWNAPGT